MISSSGHRGHSADVSMRLLVNGASLPIAPLGPDFLLLDTGIEHPPGDASIVMRVDDSERRWEVRLPDGIRVGMQKVSIAAHV